MDRKYLKQIAKDRLKVNKWNMVLATLIITVLSGVIASLSGATFTLTVNGEEVNQFQASPALQSLGSALTIFVLTAVEVGTLKFFRNNITVNERPEVAFDGFKFNYFKNVITLAVRNLIVVVGFVLFIVPGIILGLCYALVPYIVAENPDMSLVEILKTSRQLMRGHKGEFFVLRLSFLGWQILNILTLGILGILYVNPYEYQTEALYCDRILSGGAVGAYYQQETNYEQPYEQESSNSFEEPLSTTFEESTQVRKNFKLR